MKRIDITAIVLGTLDFAFFFPVVVLFAGAIVLIFGKTTGGISAVAGDFNFAFGLRRIWLLIVFIVCVPILVGWVRRRISGRRSSRKPNPNR